MDKMLLAIIRASRKVVAIILMISVLFNVIIPKTQKIKEYFVAAINCAVETQTNFLDKYAESVVSVTNEIAENVLNALNMAGLAGEKINKKADGKKREGEETAPINTSNDNGIIIKNKANGPTQLNLLKVKAACLAYSNVYNDANLYGDTGLVRPNEITDTGILFFILFAILVVRIKDTIAVLYNNNRIAGINRLV
ncbi:hypothetical protein [Candidatus Ruminimicrobium bovinum]|uniref:hypothetical protein n=1 Tax=Candidatus Ruminimicrobium bovinum TaxID=3242779 RepID=UPI0039B92189